MIEHGLTVGGKTPRDHLEAADHYEAIAWMRDIARSATPLGEGYCLRAAPADRRAQPGPFQLFLHERLSATLSHHLELLREGAG